MTAQSGRFSNSRRGLDRRLPTVTEAKSAAATAVVMASALERGEGSAVGGPEGTMVRIEPALGELIIELLGHVGAGKMVSLAPFGAKLTACQAAELLNVPHDQMAKLLSRGKIAFEQSGRHRLVPLPELMEYREERERKQEEALNELSRLGQEFDQA